jgi:hypothetical protein
LPVSAPTDPGYQSPGHQTPEISALYLVSTVEVSRANGRKGIQWSVAKAVAAELRENFPEVKPGEQPDGTFAVAKAEPSGDRKSSATIGALDQPSSELERQLADSIALVNARKQAQSAQQAAPAEQPARARLLSNQTKHLVDVYADLVHYASAKHGNAVRPDDIRAMMTTVFINLAKGGNAHAA